VSNRLDIKHLVFLSSIACYPTPELEKRLSEDARLVDDLALSSMDIYYLGLSLEVEMTRRNFSALTDEQIMGWRTVRDIIDTLEQLQSSK
jgi:acyl carrier protein